MHRKHPEFVWFLKRTFLLFLCAFTPLASRPLSRADLPWWQHRFEQKAAALASRPPRLVFYGDSIMQYLESTTPFDYRGVWDHYYGGRDAVNLGFKGDPTSALIWRLDNGEAAGIQPRLAIVLIGANNFGRLHWPADETVAAIEKTVALIHQKLPQTRILLLGVLPSGRSAWVHQSQVATNRALAAYYGTGEYPFVIYRDVSGIFEHGGVLDTSLFIDPHLTPPDPPLHPSPEGWRRIAARIEPDVARAMGDAPREPMRPLDLFGR